ncbi:MAG: ATP-binding cassette domain-containing protein [Acidimicrobiia bacterium]|nr:ATP-binding cassette domain-containing protein [Acidimicrobiia bacterium]
MTNAIEAHEVSKRYRTGARAPSSLREAITARLAWRTPADPTREVWPLRDVTFEVATGEVLGVIGRNGAGKSTLLKVLSRITEPTSGVTRTRGRVASLLEVGTGFHPELTGRENVYLNGAILGLHRREITERLDAIVEFSGVGRYIDTPIKRYSSGMNLRLAFAVAAHVEPDVLIVDEVLAVGDAEFQRKCLAGMGAVGADGRTVVLVSHDLDAVSRLCPRSLWVDGGRLRMDGRTEDVVDAYMRSTRQGPTVGEDVEDPQGRVVLHAVRTADHAGQETTALRRDRPFRIEVELSLRERVPGLDIALYLLNQRGVRVFDEVWSDTVPERAEGPGRLAASVTVPPLLNVGDYAVGVWVGQGFEEILSVDAAAAFSLEGSAKGRPDRVVELLVPWQCRTVTGASPTEPAPSSASGKGPGSNGQDAGAEERGPAGSAADGGPVGLWGGPIG